MEVKGRNQFADMDAPWRDEDLLHQLYIEEGLSTTEIGDKLGCSTTTAHEWIQRAGIETRPSRSERHPWIGVFPNGYEACRHYDGDSYKFFYLHRLLAVAKYGFEELAGKEVHHINGVTWDNRPENIELINPSEHRKLHIKRRNQSKDYADETVLKELYKNMTRKQLADELGCTEDVIKYWLNKHGIKKSQLRREG